MKYDEDLNFIGFLYEIWHAKTFLIVAVVVSFCAAFVTINMQQERYEARMMIAPAQHMDVPVNARFGGHNSVYAYRGDPESGQSFSGSFSNFSKFEALIGGVSVSEILLRDSEIVSGVLDDRRMNTNDVAGEQSVSLSSLANYIRKTVSFDPFGETEMREMVYQHPDPVFAVYFLQQLHRVSDQLIRSQLRAQIDERVAYLQRVIAKATHPEQKRVMTSMLMEQERLRMMASMDSPVAASVVEHAAVSERSVWPDPYLFYGVLMLLGTMCGYFLFGITTYRKHRDFSIYEPSSVGAGSGKFVPVMRRKVSVGESDGQGIHAHGAERPVKYSRWFHSRAENSNRKTILSKSSGAIDDEVGGDVNDVKNVASHE